MAERFHATAQQVFDHRISAVEAQVEYGHLGSDQTARLWTESRMPENAFALSADLARGYVPRLGVRTVGSLRVSPEFKAEQLWIFDERQAKLVKAMGLKTV
jgi:hypothetical protein